MAKKENPLPKKKIPLPPPKRKGAGMWIGLMIFVSVWMFILGIFVGRGTAPIQFDIQELQKELAALKAEFLKKEQNRFENRNDTATGKTELHFYEILKDSRSSTRMQPDLTKPKTEPVPETADTNRENKAAPTLVETARAPSTGKTDLTGEEPEAAPGSNEKKAAPFQGADTGGASRKGAAEATGKKAENGVNLTIQVASFKDVIIADTTVADLIRKGYPAYRTIGDVQGKGTWFRVRIGNFKSREAAGPTLDRLKKEGVKAILVQR